MICAGREGDDDYVKIEPGIVPDEIFESLYNILATARFAREINSLPTFTIEETMDNKQPDQLEPQSI